MSEINEESVLGTEVPAEAAAPKKRGRPRKVQAEGTAPKRVAIRRKPKVTVKAENPAKEDKAEEVQKELPLEAAEAAPAAEPVQAMQEEAVPAHSSDNAPASAEGEEARDESQPQMQRGREFRDHRQNGRRDKFQKKSRRPAEDFPPEINLDEHPDAPQLFISVLTALHLDQLRDRAREAGIPEDVILDSRRQDLIAKMGRKPVIINTGRGKCVNEEDLAEALKSGAVSWYATDVYPSDPPAEDYPLLGLENVTLTPHVGANTVENLLRIGNEVYETIDNLIKEGRI